MKKLLILFVAVFCAVAAFAQNGQFDIDVLRFKIIDPDSHTVEVSSKIWGMEGDLVIPSKVTYDGTEYTVVRIAQRGFSNSKLTSVEIPGTVTLIDEGAFSGCGTLTSVKIPASVSSIGARAFQSCSALTSVEIPSGVKSIGASAFFACRTLTSVKIPASVSSIGASAFQACEALPSVEIPSGITSIEQNTFTSCYSLKSVNLPDGLTAIGMGAFGGCGFEEIEIPASVTAIDSYAFNGCPELKSFFLPRSVTTVGEYAFASCDNLEKIECASDNPYFTSNDGVLFDKDMVTLLICPGGKSGSYQIPASVKKLATGAFSGCEKLTEIVIPNSVESIDGIFLGCTSLSNIKCASDNPYYSDREGVLFNKDLTTLLIFPPGRNGSYEIPSTVTTIGSQAFYACHGLTSVDIPSSVTVIEELAFWGSVGLTSVKLPDSLVTIGKNAFQGLGFTSVTIPASVKSIGERAFSGCQSLASVKIQGPVTEIAEATFMWCSSLTSVELPASVTKIADWAFSQCNSLYSINIPSAVTEIGLCAFQDCRPLTKVVIPSSIKSIGNSAFTGCALKEVYYGTEDPIEANEDIFMVYDYATLYVSASAMDKIRVTNPWCLFKNIVAHDFGAIEEVAADLDPDAPVEVYTISGIRVASSLEGLPPGLYVVRSGSKSYKIAVR